MAVGFLISLPEGLEAFLIIAFLAAFLYQTGQKSARLWVVLTAALAIIASVALSGLTGSGGSGVNGQSIGFLKIYGALLSLLMITGLMGWTWRRENPFNPAGGRLTDLTLPSVGLGMIGLLSFVVVLHEALDTSMFVGTVAANVNGAELLPGIALGLAFGIGLAFISYLILAWLNPRAWLIASILLFAFAAAGLGGHAIKGLGELGIVPQTLSAAAWDTNWLVPQNGVLGRVLHIFIGYEANPNLLGALFYFTYLLAVCLRFYTANRVIEQRS